MLLFLGSCVDQTTKSRASKNKITQGTTTSTTATTKSPTFSSNENLFWYSGGEKSFGTITISQNTKTVIYLRGKIIHEFLDNKLFLNDQKKYCVVLSFDSLLTKKQLRVRAIPIIQNDFITGTLEKLFRIDLTPEFESQNFASCDGDLPVYNNKGLVTSTAINGTTENAFTPLNICSGCSGLVFATNISLYAENLSTSGTNLPLSILNKIPINKLEINGLGFRIDLNTEYDNTGLICNNENCTAKGFNCCLEGQCVKDGEQKTSAASDLQYLQAISDVTADPKRFINWPNIFYVCPNIIHVPDPVVDNTDENQLSQDLFLEYLGYYYCLLEGKNTVPDFDGVGVCEPTSVNQSREERFIEIRTKVWKMCGCKANPFPTDPDEPYCPDFGLKLVKDGAGKITSVECDIPQPPQEPKPFQNLKVNISGRSTPHRFFRADDGTSVDEPNLLINNLNEVKAEGNEFSYLDTLGKTGPQNESFNMNAILGQYNVNLSGAVPATVIRVDFNQQYIIQTTNGFHTPCPTCTKDNWFDVFSAFPATKLGKGLQAIGYNTVRDNNAGYNLTSGNYEDTIFGRACWIPPTMIPFSHAPGFPVETQRLNRLKTQAAFYSNGYRRDWFGFNKGAVIGSFDGVSWFAIGTGRRITSTGTRLFLAINQDFGDLADTSALTVQVIQDLGSNEAADSDYHADLKINDARQNQAGSCQKYHICTNDIDCVTKLGWEYSCNDVTRYKTSWPKFDSNGFEIANTELSDTTWENILFGFNPVGGVKRCMYRGTGAPCKKNYKTDLKDSLSSTMWACAPNFYCADLSSLDFNDHVWRTPTSETNILYGQEANVLGRPLNYVSGGKSLSTEIKSNILHNALLQTTVTSDWGICRPGRRIVLSTQSNALISSHSAPDSSKRTDFINQIGNCNSYSAGNNRVVTCPTFDMAELNPADETEKNTGYGNLLRNDSTVADLKLNIRAHQNMCGGESRDGSGESVFNTIESLPLPKVFRISSKTLVADACLRRAGAVCHTDLDCAPNRLHTQEALIYGKTFFGNTQAELDFWTETLTCSQASPKPVPNSEFFNDYDLSQNRCCREVGKTFSMATQYNGNSVDPDIIPEQDEDDRAYLNTSLLPYNNSSADGRYSRYAVIDIENRADGNNPNTTPYFQAPFLKADGNGQMLTPRHFQWKSIMDTGKLTCCGGGYIRKFADGTHDWRNNSRLNFDISNLECLNYQDETFRTKPAIVTKLNYNKDYEKLCLAPGDIGTSTEGGCIQTKIPQTDGYTLALPKEKATTTATLSTTPDETPSTGAIKQVKTLSSEVPYTPTPYPTTSQVTADLTAPINFMLIDGPATAFYLPIYLGGRNTSGSCAINFGGNPTSCYKNITAVSIEYMSEGKQVTTTILGAGSGGTNANPSAATTSSTIGSGTCTDGLTFSKADQFNETTATKELYCIYRDVNGYDVMLVLADKDKSGWTYAGVKVTFNVQGTSTDINTTASNRALEAGNDLYYLTKLGRLELLGIPQLVYEPLYCNSNRSKLVEGIFDIEPQTRSTYETSQNSFFHNSVVNNKSLLKIYDSTLSGSDPANSSNRVSMQNKISIPAIYSADQFTCCTKLGEEATANENCCSNFRVDDGTGKLRCALPPATDLNVYFNPFVSGEGVGTTLPSGGLKDTDFIPETGEPKLNAEVYEKLNLLGEKFCSSKKTRTGAAFGDYFGEPNSGNYTQIETDQDFWKIYGIMDSLKDYDETNNNGFIPFLQGYRWNHHIYCTSN